MTLRRATHPDPNRVRRRMLRTSLKALKALREELDDLVGREIGVTKVWAETYKLVADQIRRDLPDAEGKKRGQQTGGGGQPPKPVSKPTLGELRIVG